MEIRPDSMGRAIPGHKVDIVDDSGNIVPPGNIGEVAIQRPDPVMFLGYWGDPKATEEKFIGDWCLTGDIAKKDEDGYFYFVSRKDDVIKSSGYRIGPSEIEECLMKHPAVATAAVIGSPHEIRGVIVKAFIVLKPEISPDSSLVDDIQNFVKGKLATYEYPREIEFIKELPLTATGKVMRKELRKMEMEKKAKK
jgi:acetyl-CoA synthetase